MSSTIFPSPSQPIMVGATQGSAGTAGLVPAPSSGDNNKVLRGSGLWDTAAELPAVTASDNGKALIVNNGAWTLELLQKFYRQFWDSTNSISVTLAANSTYLAWCAGNSAGTSGAIMDATYGAIVFVSNGKYAIIHKGSGITVSESSGNLVISSSSNIAMGIVEL